MPPRCEHDPEFATQTGVRDQEAEDRDNLLRQAELCVDRPTLRQQLYYQGLIVKAGLASPQKFALQGATLTSAELRELGDGSDRKLLLIAYFLGLLLPLLVVLNKLTASDAMRSYLAPEPGDSLIYDVPTDQLIYLWIGSATAENRMQLLDHMMLRARLTPKLIRWLIRREEDASVRERLEAMLEGNSDP